MLLWAALKSLSTTHPLLIHFSSTFHPLLIHYLSTTHPLLIHSSPTPHPLFTHSSPTLHPLLTHSSSTLHPLLLHSSSTPPSLFIHSSSTPYPFFNHVASERHFKNCFCLYYVSSCLCILCFPITNCFLYCILSSVLFFITYVFQWNLMFVLYRNDPFVIQNNEHCITYNWSIHFQKPIINTNEELVGTAAMRRNCLKYSWQNTQ